MEHAVARVRQALLAHGHPDTIRAFPEGTRTAADFAADLRSLEAATARFLEAVEKGTLPPHYLFGMLTRAQWGRWAYRHMDHHLRQFGL